jgi:(E)-4-hydroxy-3-methylbut-2-enyl-diphosphate synthase
MLGDNFMERTTKTVKIGNISIGGNNPIAIQSMTNTKTHDVEATVKQILSLEKAGCDIARVAVPDAEAANAIKSIKKSINIPLVADIHFDYKLALICVENGIDKLRINPGNIGSVQNVREVVKEAKAHNVPIRIGVNSGSVEKELLTKFGGPTADAMIESARRHIVILEDMDFTDIVVSLKASDVKKTIEVYRKMSSIIKYPLHLGVTEAGTTYKGIIKSAVGIGTLLSEGIGDTIRVSLTADPVEEVKAAKEILKSLDLYKNSIDVVSCPTCGRTNIDIISIVNQVEQRLENSNIDTNGLNLKLAIMGCAVNGPGEAREADIGIAGGKGEGLIFKKGQIIKKVKEENLVDALFEEIINHFAK